MGRHRIYTNFPSHLLVACKREVSFLLIVVGSVLAYCSVVSLSADLFRLAVYLFIYLFRFQPVWYRVYCFSLFLGTFKRCGTLWVRFCIAFNVSSFTTIELTKKTFKNSFRCVFPNKVEWVSSVVWQRPLVTVRLRYVMMKYYSNIKASTSKKKRLRKFIKSLITF